MKTDFVQGELIYYAHLLSKDYKELIIVPLGDVHFGNPSFSPKHLDRTLNFINETENAYTFLLGDLCESESKLA